MVPLVPGVGIAVIVVPGAMPTPTTSSPTTSPVVLMLVTEVDEAVVVPVTAVVPASKKSETPLPAAVAAEDNVIVPLVPGVGIAEITAPAGIPVPTTLSPTTNPVVLMLVTDVDEAVVVAVAAVPALLVIVVPAAMPVPLMGVPAASVALGAVAKVSVVDPLIVVAAMLAEGCRFRVPGPDFTNPMLPLMTVLKLVVF